jgi:cyclophilin family peptidyl-prolyl cis-trans isomerase
MSPHAARPSLLGVCGAAWLLLAGPAAAAPQILPIPDTDLLGGSPLHISVNGVDPTGGPLTFTAMSTDPPLVAVDVLEGNRSLSLRVTGYGEMVFQLFEQRVPRATSHIIQLAESGFYNGNLFHRVVNGFVIQAGEPPDVNAGSGLGLFNDQYHVDIQHNRPGMLGMAKAYDDFNDSQFYITEISTRALDYSYTIFGVMVLGEDVREAVSNVSVDSDGRPVQDVVIESAQVFIDTQDAVLMLKAPEGATGTAGVIVTATDAAGESTQVDFVVHVTPDQVNSPPFLADIPPLSTPIDTPLTFQLEAIDVEGDAAHFLDQDRLYYNNLDIYFVADADLPYVVDFDTGEVTVAPQNGLSGVQYFIVATAVDPDYVDYQIAPITIGETTTGASSAPAAQR